MLLPPTPPEDKDGVIISEAREAAPHGSNKEESRVPTLMNLRKDVAFSMADEVVKGLADGQPSVVPGEMQEDEQYRWSRSIPTLTLYSDEGLAIYSKLAQMKEYYVFPAELEILMRHGEEIAARMFGLPATKLTNAHLEGSNGNGSGGEKKQSNHAMSTSAVGGAAKEKWGDESVGVNNNGVNGGLSMGEARVALAVELGSGSLDKTKHLLAALHKVGSSEGCPFKRVEYQALDVEQKTLEETLVNLYEKESKHVTLQQDSTGRVVASGIVATYDEGLAHLGAHRDDPSTQRSIMWLGSSIGNFNRVEATAFLKNIADNVLAPGDTMLIGVDSCDDGPMIETAYNDPQGITAAFILEGVTNAGKILHGDSSPLRAENFEYVARWNAAIGRHEAYVRCKIDNLEIELPAASSAPASKVTLKKDELLSIEVSYKYTHREAISMFNEAGLRLVQQWTDSRRLHSVWVLEKPPFTFPLTKTIQTATERVNPYGLPSLAEWETMWKYWDTITLGIIPRDLLMTKPIPLRHIILFYTGHIPAFAGIHLSRYFNEPLTEPAHFAEIFERGIDPKVEDPTLITHSHSVVPTNEADWPSLKSILEYQGKIRQRIKRVYEEVDSRGEMTRKLSRVMMMIFEHEAMHAETLIYIALQASHLNPAPGFMKPDFAGLSAFWDGLVASEEDLRDSPIDFAASTIEIGHDDNDQEDGSIVYDPSHTLGWDLENPKRQIYVPAFRISATPITNGQYLSWLRSQDKPSADLFLSSWSGSVSSLEQKNIGVKTLYGRVPFDYAKHWPATGSAFQLNSYAKAKRGRLPTRGELAVWHRQNPPNGPLSNVGFTNLHPVPAMLPHKQRDGSTGHGSDGGVWMWSRDKLEQYDGYVPSSLYPGYSSDFFDDSHQLILGGSYATPPRLARPTFVNWYQTTYPYVVAGARIVYE